MQLFTVGAGRLAAAALITLMFAGTTSAHIHLLAPDGGQEFEAGTIATISWEIEIQHNTQNWDVWYSTSGANGPWIPITMNLPPGETTAGSIHYHAWTIPETFSGQCFVRVRQDNSGTDWEDISDASFSIVEAPTRPEGSKLSDGVRTGGQSSDMFDSDDQYFELDPSPTSNPFKQKIHLIVQSTSPAATPGSFSFRLESAMMGGPSGEVIQEVRLMNYNTGIGELVDVRAVANSDESVELTPGGDLSRFVQPITDEITAEIVWKSEDWSGPSFFWSIDVDDAVWLVSG